MDAHPCVPPRVPAARNAAARSTNTTTHGCAHSSPCIQLPQTPSPGGEVTQQEVVGTHRMSLDSMPHRLSTNAVQPRECGTHVEHLHSVLSARQGT
eukprot:71568-Amphidinium_carterae.1